MARVVAFKLSAVAGCVSGAMVLLSLLIPTNSIAAVTHPFLSTITGPPTASGGFEDACGVALGNGDVYVSDYYHDAVEILNPSSEPPFQLEAQIADESPGSGPCKLALDSSSNLYVYNWHLNVVKYEPGGFSAGAGTVIDSAQPTGLAVDQTTGDVYVAHRTYVAEYGPTGALITDEIGLGSLEEGYGVAVSDFSATKGFIYVPDAADHTVKVYDPAVELENPVEEINGAATPQGAFKSLLNSEVAVDNSTTSPSYGHVFVLDDVGHGLSEHPEAVLDEFNSAGAYRGQITGFTDAEPSGVALNPTNHDVYVTSGNTEGSAIFVYGPAVRADTLKVVKSGAGGGSVSSQPAGINCGEACTAEYNEEQQVTLFASPDAHSVFTGWTVSGSNPCPGGEGSTCSVVLGTSVDVHANFEEPTQQTLQVSVSGSGSVTSSPAGLICNSGTCSEHFSQGRLVTLTAHPAAHSEFTGWGVGDCESESGPGKEECRVTMNAAKAVSAEFASVPQKALTVTVTGSGEGLVKSSPVGISCPGSCSEHFDAESAVTLVATPSPNSTFAGFTGGGCSGSGICDVTMSEAESVSAEFVSLDPSPPLKSTIVSPPSGAPLNASPPLAAAGLYLRSLPGGGLAAIVSGPGTLSAAGKGLKRAEFHSTTVPDTVTFHLALSRAGRRDLARSRQRRLMVEVKLTFTPSDGGSVAHASKLLRFATKSG